MQTLRRAPLLVTLAAFSGTLASGAPDSLAAAGRGEEPVTSPGQLSSGAATASGKRAPAAAESTKAAAAKPAAKAAAKSAAKSSSGKRERSAKRAAGKAAQKAQKRKRTAAKRSSGKRKEREVSRTPNRRTATNMPRGWSWPPSKAMVRAGERCTAALDAAGIGWRPAPPEGKIVTPVVLDSLVIGGVEYHPVFRKPPFPMDCHLALALATHSPTLYALGVRKVSFGSIFRFTKVRAYGKTKNVLSRHALGLAMDVVSFEDETGAVRVVEKDYPLGDELLVSVESTLNGSGGFRTVLTPRNDPTSHHDHFHIEADVAYYEDERNLAGILPGGAADEDRSAIDDDGDGDGERAASDETSDEASDALDGMSRRGGTQGAQRAR
jgi:hypothetical protein